MISRFLALLLILGAFTATAAAQTDLTVATVRTDLATQFWGDLVKEFEKAGQCKIHYTKEQKNLYAVAKDPHKKVDLVITHIRHGFLGFCTDRLRSSAAVHYEQFDRLSCSTW
jgi:ABC-type sugar transport system substrate-binding protein